MKELQEALETFWSQFAPAYLAGLVPDGTPFPYITFDAARPDALGAVPLAACLWLRREPGFDAQSRRATVLDRIAAAIPPEGVRLPLGDGFALLERNPADFQTLLADPEDPAVLGGRTACLLRYFSL